MSEIWERQSIHLLTRICNIPFDSSLQSYKVDYAVHGDRNLVSLSVVFQKSPSRHQKHKSPSTLRHNQRRSEIWLKRRSAQVGLGFQATSTSPAASQPEPPLSLISVDPTTPAISFNSSSEHKTTISHNATSAPNHRHSNSMSLRETSELTDGSLGSSSVSSELDHWWCKSTLNSSIPSTKRSSSTRSITSSTQSTAKVTKHNKPNNPLTAASDHKSQPLLVPAFDFPASLHQSEASTRSESLPARQAPPLQTTTPTLQSTTQSENTQQDDGDLSIVGPRRRRSRYRPKIFRPDIRPRPPLTSSVYTGEL